jgi:hypothetical protein
MIATVWIGRFCGLQVASINESMKSLIIGSLRCGSWPESFFDGLNGHSIEVISHEDDLNITLLEKWISSGRVGHKGQPILVKQGISKDMIRIMSRKLGVIGIGVVEWHQKFSRGGFLVARLSRVREEDVPKSNRGGVGRAESPEMGQLRQEMRDLTGSSEWAKYELEGPDKEATIRQRLMQAAQKEEVRISTRFDRDNQTFYFKVLGPREPTEAAGEGTSSRRGRKKASAS